MAVGGVQGVAAGSASPLASALARITKAGYYDPKDTNQDGVVSAAEEIAYELTHPSASTKSTSPLATHAQGGVTNAAQPSSWSSLTQYSQGGKLAASQQPSWGSLNLYA